MPSIRKWFDGALFGFGCLLYGTILLVDTISILMIMVEAWGELYEFHLQFWGFFFPRTLLTTVAIVIGITFGFLLLLHVSLVQFGKSKK